MNLFIETNYPNAIPLRFKGRELVRLCSYGSTDPSKAMPEVSEDQSVSIALMIIADGFRISLDRLVVMWDAWEDSMEAERDRLTAIEQERVDRYWEIHDKILAGDKSLSYLFKMMNQGKDPPESRVAERQEVDRIPDYHLQKISKCSQCREPMAVTSLAHKYCSPACHKAAKARKQTPFNQARPKVSHGHRSCEHCETSFTPKRSDARFCSTRCRVAHNRVSRS